MVDEIKRILLKRILLILCFSLLFSPLFSLEEKPFFWASAVVLYDYTTNKILFEKNPDLELAPASLTKLVTLYLGWQSLKSGESQRDDLIEITSVGSSFSRPLGSSLMLLEEGQRVTYIELLKGLAISSGNDAAYALANHLDGSVEYFINHMNELVKSLGFNHMYFEDPDGWSSLNRITAREYAQFAALYIEAFPHALKEVHSQQYFVYPKEKNLSQNNPKILTARRKKNTNLLIGRVPGVDGLKTGYIDESGFNFTATAKRGDSRFIAVILGIKNIDYFEGLSLRAEEASRLLEYGFTNFETIYPQIPQWDEVTIWEGNQKSLVLELSHKPVLTISKINLDKISSHLLIPDNLVAPITKGEKIGSLLYKNGDLELESFPLFASEDIGKGNLFVVLWHKIYRSVKNLLVH